MMRWIDWSRERHFLQFSLVIVLCATGLAGAADAPPAAPSPQSEAATPGRDAAHGMEQLGRLRHHGQRG